MRSAHPTKCSQTWSGDDRYGDDDGADAVQSALAPAGADDEGAASSSADDGDDDDGTKTKAHKVWCTNNPGRC